ncbi:hypothetical protein SAMN02910265_02376 [Ruminococcus flavefaciens]|uniref:Uncharacterized protein n=1 Tax=Ruminococcus flavefaciens TaxID=1265 RepID=A0A1H6KN79_RUMFL|nr:hypothetical protein SAMN02910265_02376 [Ruminococcus flavefaciens]
MNKYKMIKPKSDECSFFGFFIYLTNSPFPSSPLPLFPSYYIFYAMHFNDLNHSIVQGRKRECFYCSLLQRKAYTGG